MIDQDVTSNIQQQLMPHIQWARVGHCIFMNEKFDHKPHKKVNSINCQLHYEYQMTRQEAKKPH